MTNAIRSYPTTWQAMIAIATIVFCAHLVSAVYRHSVWPISSYDMFSRLPAKRQISMRVTLLEPGLNDREVLPGNFVRIEFFRAPNFLMRHLLSESDNLKRQVVSEHMLENINKEPWDHFDEVLASCRPVKNGFSGFRIQLVEYALVNSQYLRVGASTVYSYAPE